MPAGVADVLALLVPPGCRACGHPLRRADADLCPACRRALPWLGASCPACALPLPCGARCAGHGAPWSLAWAPLAHAGPARALVLALKHGRRRPVARTMAAQLVAGAPAGLLAPGVTLVPVPADPWRARRRGLDQAALLAREVAARTGLPVAACLRRPAHVGGVAPMAGRDRAERLAAGRRLEVHATRAPARPVLVDDVHTTGATLAACARALRGDGAEWVGAMTYTRTLR